MSEPNSDAPKADPPTGVDSVSDMHRALMTQMNDPVMLTAAGDEAAGDERGDEPGVGGSDSVQGMHEMLMREQAEPRDGFEPVPFWVSLVFGALLAWGGYYIGAYTADFRSDVYDRADLKAVAPPAGPVAEPNPLTVAELKTTGGRIYDNICAACHGADGKGQKGKYPPLDGSEWVIGDQASAARLSRILLYGMKDPITVSGATYNDLMPARGSELRDYQIAGVLTYVRNNWSNKADPDNAKPAITADVVKAARAKEGARKANGTQPVNQDELLKLPLTYSDTGKDAAPPKK